ncbi:hypothetical protein DFA_02122 [Cavenderia fasciculata]|uniref:RNA-binding region RNP-1 domain-containing protein n=1 Tax=Cavenderia fasciculata TaxID=261658 RepID=F4PYR9_CACFS|nr:uncharacterized protein DFA_02122 [Cavenderia fasciculata]EGG19335.1 hypothetical protein DFA_02122 [Cavenderia fasciculata]|eukprot:XP_004357606.1 hypothetical protein DFA_02122 [Cavenderia fasciculata]
MDVDDKSGGGGNKAPATPTSSSSSSSNNVNLSSPPMNMVGSLHSPPMGLGAGPVGGVGAPTPEAFLNAYAAAAAAGAPLGYPPYMGPGQFTNPYDFTLFNRNAAVAAATGYYTRGVGVVGAPPGAFPPIGVHGGQFVNQQQVIIQPEVSKMWVGNLPQDTTEDELRVFFSPYGKIESIKVDYRCAFIKYTEHILAQNAIKATNGVLFKGNKIKVNWASIKVRGKMPQPSTTSPLLFGPPVGVVPLPNLQAATPPILAAAATTPSPPTNNAIAAGQHQQHHHQHQLMSEQQIQSPPSLSSASNSIKTISTPPSSATATTAAGTILSSSSNSLPTLLTTNPISPTQPSSSSLSTSVLSTNPSSSTTLSSSISSITTSSSSVQLSLDLKDSISKNSNSNNNNLNNSSGRINTNTNIAPQHHHPYHRPPPPPPPSQPSQQQQQATSSAHQLLHYNDFEEHVVSNKSKTLSISPYDKLLLEEKNHLLYLIDHLSTTYRSIKEAKDWILLHFRCYRSIISVISSYFQEVGLTLPPPQQQQQQPQQSTTKVLPLLYLVNDILHFGLLRRRSIEQIDIIAELTEPHLSTMFVTFHDEPTQNQNQAMTILDLWESKKVYPPKIVQSLKQLM